MLQCRPDSGAPSETLTSRTRFNSLDSRVVLSSSSTTAERPAQVRSASASESPLQDSRLPKDASYVPNASCPIPEEMHKPPLLGPPNTATGSIAIRAMRSMRSVARLANWTNGKSMEKDTTIAMPPMKKRKQPADMKKNKKTEKPKLDSGRDQKTLRLSGNSLEPATPTNINTPPIQSSTVRKHGVLGLGFPSGFRFGTMRSSSAGSSGQISASSDNTASHDYRGRSSSTVSTASSLKPTSTKSRISSSSSVPVKWVEERLETVKVARRRERIVERTVETHSISNEANTWDGIVDMSPEHTSRPVTSRLASSAPRPTILTAEDVSVNGYFFPENVPIATPRRQTRLRPASDQMTGKEQIGSIRHDPDGKLRTVKT
jgi:serine/arginine repetitive matrix protein 2